MGEELSYGIDLGTTNSVICVCDVNGMLEVIADMDGNRITPSVVHFPVGEGKETVVGAHAKAMANIEPDRVAQFFKRGMGEQTFLPNDKGFVVDGVTWSPEMLSGLVLKKMASIAAEEKGEPVRSAVITVPAYFGHNEREATRTAAEIAGIEVLQLINEPTAAAVAFGVRPGSDGVVLVFDLGGGTFDVTVVEVSGGAIAAKATSGDHRLGGADFDALLVERINEHVVRETGASVDDDPGTLKDAVERAEKMKKELSSKESSTQQFAVGGKNVKVTISRQEFESMLVPHLQTVRDHIENVLDDAKLRPADLAKVLMVGGSSRIPAFQRQVEEITQSQPVFNNKTLDEDVARGAALIAQLNLAEAEAIATGRPQSVGGALSSVRVSDVASRGLGVTVTNEQNQVSNLVMIAKNHPIPIEVEETLMTLDDGQSSIQVDLNEGESDELDLVNKLAETVGTFDSPKPKGHPIRVTMAYTKDQRIVVQAYDGQTGAFLCDLVVEASTQISGSQMAVAKRQAQGLAISG